MGTLIAKSVKLSAVAAVILTLALVCMRQLPWAGGFLIGATWSMINFMLIAGILNIVIFRKDTRKLPVLLILKFPVLYAAGFFILVSRVFPVYSLLSGVSLVLVMMGVVKICLKPK